MNTIHDENKIKSILINLTDITGFDHTSEALEAFHKAESLVKEYAEHIREKTIDECIRLLRDENTMSEVIRETLGYGNHYSTMPVARGLVSRMEEKLKQLLT